MVDNNMINKDDIEQAENIFTKMIQSSSDIYEINRLVNLAVEASSRSCSKYLSAYQAWLNHWNWKYGS